MVPYRNGSPAGAQTPVRGPVTSSGAGARHSSVRVFSSNFPRPGPIPRSIVTKIRRSGQYMGLQASRVKLIVYLAEAEPVNLNEGTAGRFCCAAASRRVAGPRGFWQS